MNNQEKAMGYQHPTYDQDPSLKSSLSELSESFEKHLNPKSEKMNIQELRMGNLVKIINNLFHPKLTDIPAEVVGISLRNEPTFPKSNSVISMLIMNEFGVKEYASQFNEFIAPIPLNEKWLLKLGFKESESIHFKGTLDSDTIGFRMLCDSFEYMVICPDNGDGDFGINCQFVHQLQNLYFALTGEELPLIK